MARKTPPTVSTASRTDVPVAAPVVALMADDRTHQSQLMEPQVILERLERLEENAMRDRAAASERLLGSEVIIAALVAKIEFLERRLEDAEAVANDVRTLQMAIAQAEPITATLEVTSAGTSDAQLNAIEHKLHLLNNSIGAY